MLKNLFYTTTAVVCLISFAHCGFKYADSEGGYNFCWTKPFIRPYEVHEVRVQAIDALKKDIKASFCDISYIHTIDPWFKHNQTRYKIFVIAEHFVDVPIMKRQDIVKHIVFPILINPGDHRVEIVAKTPEEQPNGFTEEEMKYNVQFLDAEKMPVFGGNRLKREIIEWHVSTLEDDMAWKFHPNKTCQLVEEVIREKFDPQFVQCIAMKDSIMGIVAPGHEDQYKLLVISEKFLDQPPLRRTINVRRALEELITQQMYKIHMFLHTQEEYDELKKVSTTTDFAKYE